jgi:hypothetical protein
MRTLPVNLKIKQDKIREETSKTIQQAINELKNEGYMVSIKLLIQRTGYSRSTFSKKHVKEVLKRNTVCMYKNIRTFYDEEISENSIYKLKDELDKANSNKNKLENIIIQKNKAIDKLIEELDKQKKDYQLLLGQLHIAILKAEIQGVHLKFE